VVTGPAPDLLITRVEIPAEVWTGGSFDVAWTITNRGTANITGEWRDSVYLCSGSQPCTTYLLGDFRYTAGLNATSAVTRVQSMTIDRTRVTEGPYYVTVIADGRNDVFEGLPNSPAEQNNSAVSSAPASVRLTPLPDLVVNTVTAPANDVFGGQAVTVTWTVCNQGTAFTDAPFWNDRLRLYRDPNRTQLVRDYGTYPNLAYLGPGECYQQTAEVLLPTGISGPHFFAVQSDSANDVYELIENNNNLSSVTPTPCDGTCRRLSCTSLPSRSPRHHRQPFGRAIKWSSVTRSRTPAEARSRLIPAPGTTPLPSPRVPPGSRRTWLPGIGTTAMARCCPARATRAPKRSPYLQTSRHEQPVRDS